MSMQFDATYYLNQNPDVLSAVLNGLIPSAEWHYENYGWKEGRDPNPTFDTTYYLIANQDVRDAHINPLQHFLTYGAAEGRLPNPDFVARSDFDSATYLADNPDLKDAGIDTPEEAYAHFAVWGFAEGRPGVQTNEGGSIGPDGVPTDGTGHTFFVTDDGAVLTDDTSFNVTPAGTYLGSGDDTVRSFDYDGSVIEDAYTNDNDTLSIISGDNTAFASVVNIENINFRATDTVTATGLDASTIEGAKAITSDGSTGDLTVTDVQNNVTLGMTKTDADMDVTFADDALGSEEASLTVALSSAGEDYGSTSELEVTVGGDDVVTDLSIKATGDNYVTLTNGGGIDAETLTITGGGMVLTTGTAYADLETVDGSAITGGFAIDLSGNSEDVTVTGSAAADLVDFGTGIDSGDEIDLGGGTDTIVLNGGDLADLEDADIDGIEAVAFSGGAVGTFDGSDFDFDHVALGGSASITFDDYSGDVFVYGDTGAVDTGSTESVMISTDLGGISEIADEYLLPGGADVTSTMTALDVDGADEVSISVAGKGDALTVTTLTVDANTDFTVDGAGDFTIGTQSNVKLTMDLTGLTGKFDNDGALTPVSPLGLTGQANGPVGDQETSQTYLLADIDDSTIDFGEVGYTFTDGNADNVVDAGEFTQNGAGARDIAEFTTDFDSTVTIENFDVGAELTADALDLSALGVEDVSDLTFTDNAGDLEITSDAFEGTIVLTGVAEADLTNNNFIFA